MSSDERIVKAEDIFNKFKEMKEKYDFVKLDVQTEVIPRFLETKRYFTSDMHLYKSTYWYGEEWPDYSIEIGSTLGVFKVHIPINNAKSDEGKFEMECSEFTERIDLIERVEKGQRPSMAIYFNFENDH